MIFQHTWPQVLSGEKTQTRRLVKPDKGGRGIGRYYDIEYLLPPDHYWEEERPFPGAGVYREKGIEGGWLSGDSPIDPEWTIIAKWVVGRTYAVQPGRGQKAIGRIRITDIRQQNVRFISIDDVRREGFKSKYEFLETWTMMHDKAAYNVRPDGTWLDVPLQQQQYNWRKWLLERDAACYLAWVLTFELIQEAR